MSTHFQIRVAERAPEIKDPASFESHVHRAVMVGDDCIAQRAFYVGRRRSAWRIVAGDVVVGFAICSDISGKLITFLSREQARLCRMVCKGKMPSINAARYRDQRLIDLDNIQNESRRTGNYRKLRGRKKGWRE